MTYAALPGDQILMGITVAVLCGLGLWKERWFLEQTEKGRRLVRWFGPRRALLILRLLFGAGTLFGILLATDVIRPIGW